MQRRPNFFLVGAPKCGTTSLTQYLAPHPDVFICTPRETNHFCTDLDIHPGMRIADRAEYLDLFRNAGDAAVVGDATVWNLYSEVAAENIQQFAPDAKILIALRNPIDLMWSLHGWYLYMGAENLVDFEDALAAEDDRRKGLRVPNDTIDSKRLQYTDVVKFSPQIKRYLNCFDRERIHFVLFDDLVRDTPGIYYSVLQFLEVDPAYRPDFRIHGAGRQIRNPMVKRMLRRHRWLRDVTTRTLSSRARQQIGDVLNRLFPVRRQRAAQMDPTLRHQLTERLRPEMRELQELIQRDLSMWITQDLRGSTAAKSDSTGVSA